MAQWPNGSMSHRQSDGDADGDVLERAREALAEGAAGDLEFRLLPPVARGKDSVLIGQGLVEAHERRLLLVDDRGARGRLLLTIAEQVVPNLGLLLATVELDQRRLHLAQGGVAQGKLGGRGSGVGVRGKRTLPFRVPSPEPRVPVLQTRAPIPETRVPAPNVARTQTQAGRHPARHFRGGKGRDLLGLRLLVRLERRETLVERGRVALSLLARHFELDDLPGAPLVRFADGRRSLRPKLGNVPRRLLLELVELARLLQVRAVLVPQGAESEERDPESDR